VVTTYTVHLTWGWYLLLAGLVILTWAAIGFVSPRYRPIVGGCAFVGAWAVLLAWTPSSGGDFGWLGVFAVVCLAIPALGVAAVVSRFSPRLRRRWAFLGLTATVAFVIVGWFAAEAGSLRIRVSLREGEFIAEAERLLDGDEGRFNGTSEPGLATIDPETSRPELPPVRSVAGMPVLYGRVSLEPQRQVAFCLPGSEEWSCDRTLIYSPNASLDGQRGMWNTDCDLVSRRLAGDWYLQAVECPRN
jgi:hypothetical protein